MRKHRAVIGAMEIEYKIDIKTGRTYDL